MLIGWPQIEIIICSYHQSSHANVIVFNHQCWYSICNSYSDIKRDTIFTGCHMLSRKVSMSTLLVTESLKEMILRKYHTILLTIRIFKANLLFTFRSQDILWLLCFLYFPKQIMYLCSYNLLLCDK